MADRKGGRSRGPTRSKEAPLTERGRFPIVGVGSSAGGLEALEQLFTNTKPDAGIAYVLVSHLDPKHPSLLTELVSRFTTMMAVQAEDGMKVLPNRIYVIPPGSDMIIADGTLKLFKRTAEKDHELHMPIDYFLRSLAEDQDLYAIAIILSGNGSDGSTGIRSVQANLGLVMVQSPDTAKYDNMPRSAIATGLADYVLPPSEMFGQLEKYIRTLEDKMRGVETRGAPGDLETIYKIMGILRSETGHDFSLYKRNTINRRIERRMAVHQLDTKIRYVEYLRNNPSEVELLFKELLIQVTKFFRDPEAFDSLKETIRNTIFAQYREPEALRVWVPGCSTGEEVYSLAIMFCELMEETGQSYDVQIFGTDIDEDAINVARAGVYTVSIAADVSANRLNRFFIREEESFKVKKEVRDMAIFAPQNITRDPPFLRLDLISCRNLLIYFEPPLQKKILETFTYALKPNGVLFLGTSETINGFSEEFNTLESKWKIYQRKPYTQSNAIRNFTTVLTAPHAAPQRSEATSHTGPKINEAAERMLLSGFTPPSLVINNKDEIIYFHGRTNDLVEHPSGKATLNIQPLLKEDIRFQVMAAIRDARATQKTAEKHAVRVSTNGDSSFMNIIIKPIDELKSIGGLLIVFEEVVVPKEILREHQGLTVAPDKEAYISELERELSYTKESLQSTIEELETSNEELKSTNEELQSTNEELQSVAEESETAKEELHSLNEELLTVNAELEKRNDELQAANSDMKNLLNSIDVATVFLDSKFKIKRFTPQINQIMNLLPADVGRSIMDISMNLRYDGLIKDAEDVLERLIVREREVQTSDGRWFRIRILPYRTLGNVIDGVVITFIDINAQRRAQLELEKLTSELAGAMENSEIILNNIEEPLLVIDPEMKVVSANQAFYRAFKIKAQSVTGLDLKKINGGAWNDQTLLGRLKNVFDGQDVESMLIDVPIPGTGNTKVRISARKLTTKEGATQALVTIYPLEPSK